MTLTHKLDDETKRFLTWLIGAAKEIKIRVVIELPKIGDSSNDAKVPH